MKVPELNQKSGTDADETPIGAHGCDVIRGSGGSDKLCGQGGDDILYGGTGNEVVDGGAGARLWDLILPEVRCATS